MSFSTKFNQEKPYFKHIDIILTSSQGCTFHVVGELSVNWRLKVTGFTGTIALGGSAGCPSGTYTVNYNASFNYDNFNEVSIPVSEQMTVEFDTDDVCSISNVKFTTNSQSQDTKNAAAKVNDTLDNTPGTKTSFINEIKSGTCN